MPTIRETSLGPLKGDTGSLAPANTSGREGDRAPLRWEHQWVRGERLRDVELDVAAGARSGQPDQPDRLGTLLPGISLAVRSPPRTPAQRSALFSSVPVEPSLE